MSSVSLSPQPLAPLSLAEPAFSPVTIDPAPSEPQPAPDTLPQPPSSGRRALELGLAAPRAGRIGGASQFEALLAEISDRLKVSQSKTLSESGLSATLLRRGQFGDALSLLTHLNELGTKADTHERIIGENRARVAEIDASLAPLNSELSSVNNRLSQIATRIGELNALIAGTPEPWMYSELSALTSERSQRLTRKGELEALTAPLASERAGLMADIRSRTAQQTSLLQQMSDLSLSTLPFRLMGAQSAAESARDGAAGPRAAFDEIEAALSELLRRSTERPAEQARDAAKAEEAQRGLGQRRGEQGDGIAARFGAIPPAQSRALGFAAAVEAALGALAMMSSERLLRSAEDLVAATVPRQRLPL